MRKISEIRGEDALDVLADILEPISEIFTDKKFVNAIRSRNKMEAAMILLREHKTATLAALAALEGVEPDEYNPSILDLPMLILNLLNDPDIVAVFHLAEQKTPSGSATESTEETEQE